MSNNKRYASPLSDAAKQKIVDWMIQQGFVRSHPETRPSIEVGWEIAWGSDSGYGYVTLFAYPHDYGWELALLGRQGEDRQRVNFGLIRTVPELMAVYGLLSSMSWERWNEVIGVKG